MTFKSITTTAAAAAFALVSGAISAQATTCEISLPAPGNAAVANVNSNIVNAINANYPNIAVTAPAPGGASVNVTIPGCNPADFANTGAAMAGGTDDDNGAMAKLGSLDGKGAAAAAAAGLALILILADSSSTTTTPTATE